MGAMKLMKGVRLQGDAEKATQTRADTIEITRKVIGPWKSPPFQRPLHINQKVMEAVEDIRRTGVISGVLTLGVLDDETYIVDGQHRLHAYILSELPVAYADVRWHYFTAMGDMSAEYVRLNSQLVRLRPDDILKGLESSDQNLQKIRRKCGYVGYDTIRRGPHAPVLSMSTLLRCWLGSRNDVPAFHGSAQSCVEQLDAADVDILIEFLNLCFEAWRRDTEYQKLWGALNLILCAWLYRRVVEGMGLTHTSRATRLKPDEFRKGLLSLSADADYLDYLVGRNIGDRDRAPAYARIKTIFSKRYLTDRNLKLLLPSPNWANAK